MTTELRTAIQTKGNAIAGLSGQMWYLEAPPKTGYPYSVFSFVTNTESRDSINKFEKYYLQINIYDTDGERIETIKERIKNLFDDSEKSFSLPSYNVDSVDFAFARAMKVDKVYQITVQYKIDLTKK